eukprot:15430276-Alexandrium_andersonii.AAC.1
MSASLVGSEMCIRDRCCVRCASLPRLRLRPSLPVALGAALARPRGHDSVCARAPGQAVRPRRSEQPGGGHAARPQRPRWPGGGCGA